MLVECWASVVDAGPTLNQHWFKVLCLLGYSESKQMRPFGFALPYIYTSSGAMPKRTRLCYPLWSYSAYNDEMWIICCFNVGPASQTVAKQYSDIGSTYDDVPSSDHWFLDSGIYVFPYYHTCIHTILTYIPFVVCRPVYGNIYWDHQL